MVPGNHRSADRPPVRTSLGYTAQPPRRAARAAFISSAVRRFPVAACISVLLTPWTGFAMMSLSSCTPSGSAAA